MEWRPLVLAPATTGGASRRRPPYFRTKKLALIGSTLSVQYAPWFDPSWTIAAHPCSRKDCKREPDWYFDMHRPECFEVAAKSWNGQYLPWLKNLQTPIFMQEDAASYPWIKTADGHRKPSPWAQVPMAVKYPIEIIKAEFRSTVTGRLFASNHCAYMIALAMTEGVTHIGLFGCQYSGPDRGAQRESLTYWLGRFEQYGGTVVVSDEFNTLLSPRELYGYESHDDHGKLIPAYRAPQAAPVVAQAADGTVTLSETKVVDMNQATGRIPLMAPPDGMAIAWERSGHLICA